jgi:RHS repeat-associated protein
VGNRSAERRPAGTTTYAYDAADQLSATTGLLPATYAYDARGNQTRAGDRTFSYDRADHLIATTGAGAATTYAYDGDGNRLRSSSPAGVTNESWDPAGDLPTLALERDGTTTRRYAYGLNAISQTTGSATSYYHHDLVGSVVELSDAAGAPTATYAYEPFGSVRSSSGTAADNPLRFTGEHQDPSGLYYLRARSYDPTTGRFLQTDPVSPALTDPSLSPYAYVGNRPTMLTDPSGMCFFCLKTLKSVGHGLGKAGSWAVHHPWQTAGFLAGGPLGAAFGQAAAWAAPWVTEHPWETVGFVALGAALVLAAPVTLPAGAAAAITAIGTTAGALEAGHSTYEFADTCLSEGLGVKCGVKGAIAAIDVATVGAGPKIASSLAERVAAQRAMTAAAETHVDRLIEADEEVLAGGVTTLLGGVGK